MCSPCARATVYPLTASLCEGSSAVDESALTGESIPVDKTEGDRVSAATINQAGYIRCRATRIGEDTTLSQIIRMVSDAAATKAPIAKLADKVSGIFVPTVHVHRARDADSLACRGADSRLRARPRDIGAGHKLPLRARPCNAGSNNGRQWARRKARRPVQDRRRA